MAPPKQKRLSRDEFLDLLDDEDVEALWKLWNLPPAISMSKKAPVFVAAVEKRSHTSLLQDALSLGTPTLHMLRDLLTFLDGHHAALRTTGSLVVLNDEFDIAPQQVDTALKWSAKKLRRHPTHTWEEIETQIRDEITPLFRKIDTYGEVRIDEDEEDPGEIYMGAITGSGFPGSKVTVFCDVKGFRAREEYIAKLAALQQKLAPIYNFGANTPAQRTISVIEGLLREEQGRFYEDQDKINRSDRERYWSSRTRLTEEDREAWKRFEEAVLFLAEIEESSEIVDLLRMDLFRNRPQLYELWIVVAILGFMRRAGYGVELLGLRTTESGRTVWNLNYSKSQTPIARLLRRSDGTKYYLFYQLFRTGTKRANMPDIALMPSGRATDRPVWIMDPKHSERRSYSLADYRDVGQRYQTTFRPRRTWLVEYYPRPDLGPKNPLDLSEARPAGAWRRALRLLTQQTPIGPGEAELIRDVAPEGLGYASLLNRLMEFHGYPATTMVVIDLSSSFAANLPRVKDDLRELLAQGVVLSQDIIWFADKATSISGYLDDLERGVLEPPAGLGGATLFGPALELLLSRARDGSEVQSLRIYTDGGFTDISIDDARERLTQYGDVKVVDFRP